jgi:tripeptidyl-peptidase-1
MLKTVVKLALLSSTVLAAVPHGWTKVTPLSPDAREKSLVTVGLMIKQKNLDYAEQVLARISDPSDPLYGMYLSWEQVGRLTGNPEATASTVSFLRSRGIRDIDQTVHGEYVKAKMTIAQAEALFGADFNLYVSQNQAIVKSEGYSIPLELREQVNGIAHISYFPNSVEVGKKKKRNKNKKSTRVNGGEDFDNVTPQLLRKYYGIDIESCSTGKSTQSVFESLGQDYSPADLEAFQRRYSLNVRGVDGVIGPNDGDECALNADTCGEANLDVQYIMGIAQNCPTVYWSIPLDETDPSDNPFITWMYQVANSSHPPLVHSISYGGKEIESAEARGFDAEMMKFGLRGLTVLVSSGDNGVSSSSASNDESQCGYFPSFPATSRFVTAVGATQGPEAGKEEIVCSTETDSIITSGGGFSALYDRPTWQKSAVEGYLQTVTDIVPGFNSKGRAIPDVSALGRNYVIVDGGQIIPVSGTSASAPVFAAMITLINDERIAAGKKPLGFLNPVLYKLDSSVWNDITSGRNNCAARGYDEFRIVCCEQGFRAAQGWDPATGLGTPKFQLLRKALLAL